MSAAFAIGATKEFELALDELAKNLRFVKSSSTLRPRLRELINWPGLGGEAKSLVTDFLSQKDVELSLYYRGSLVILAGNFEELVRKIMRDAVNATAAKAGTYDALSERVRNQNISRTGKALITAIDPPDHLKIDFQVLIKNLVTCVPGATAFSLNAEAFTYFVSNITPAHLENALESVDVTLNWDDFGRDAKFESMFATKGAKETGKAVATHLKDFIKLRNHVAHTGVAGTSVTEDILENYIAYFRIFSPILAKSVATRIK